MATSLALVAWLVGSKLTASANHRVTRPEGFNASVVSIPGKNHQITGWWTEIGHDSPVVLLLHGVRADRASMVTRAQLLQKHGFSTLAIDLQAQGETPGDEITFGERESSDVVASLAWIKDRASHRKIGVIGCSMGGASALLAPQPLGVDAVVLEAVYPRIGRAVENRIRLWLGPLAPVVTPLLVWQMGPRLHLKTSNLEPIRFIGALGAPVLIAAGSADEHTTLSESKELYGAAAAPKELWIAQGAKHQDLLAFDPKGYESNVLRFLIDHLRAHASYHAQRLAKAQVEKLIESGIAGNQPVVFGSYQGVHHCCDLGEPSLQFLPEHVIRAFGDGYVPWEERSSYTIADDGKIVVSPTWRESFDGYIYSYGADLYLVKEADVEPDLGFEPGTRWPFKAAPVGDLAEPTKNLTQ